MVNYFTFESCQINDKLVEYRPRVVQFQLEIIWSFCGAREFIWKTRLKKYTISEAQNKVIYIKYLELLSNLALQNGILSTKTATPQINNINLINTYLVPHSYHKISFSNKYMYILYDNCTIVIYTNDYNMFNSKLLLE